jgi:hypothetical protein
MNSKYCFYVQIGDKSDEYLSVQWHLLHYSAEPYEYKTTDWRHQ